MKVKTSELSGAALDWAVAKCNQDWTDEDRWYNTIGYVDSGDPDDEPYMPSENWAQGGPIVEREGIAIDCVRCGGEVDGWIAALPMYCEAKYEDPSPTPLIAAMRCFVARNLGDEVDVPSDI